MIINYLLWRLLEFLQVYVYIHASSLRLPVFRFHGILTRVFCPQPAVGIEEVPDIGPLHAHLGSRNDEAQEK